MHRESPIGHVLTSIRNGVQRRWQLLIFVLTSLVFLYLTGQLTAPFLAGDDWPSLLPASQQNGLSLPWANTLAEGRWLNYLWYHVSVRLSPETGNALFTAAYIAMTGTVAWLVSSKRTFLLCALALFFSPMFAELSLWPITSFCGVALCAVAMFALARFGERNTLPIVFISTVALVMAYPPLASIVLLVAAINQNRPTVRSNMTLVVVFVVAFASSVLLIDCLNALFHGYFGVQVATWRDPHPLRSLSDLDVNMKIAAVNWQLIAHQYKLSIVCASVAGASLLTRRPTCARGLSVIFVLMVCLCVAIGVTTITGVPEPGRSVPWLWVSACLLCTLLAGQQARVYRFAGVILITILSVSGAVFSWQNYQQFRPLVIYMEVLGDAVSSYRTTGRATMALAGNISDVTQRRWLPGDHWPEPGLEWIMWKQYGVVLTRCDYDTCAAARKYVLAHHITQPTVIHLDGGPALVLNGYAVKEILRNYPTLSQEAALHINYQAFLAYGRGTVRITPFFPGTSIAPVSIALPPQNDGYTLQSESKSCSYLVDYKLTDVDGNQVGAGQYRTPEVITVNKSRQKGVTLLALQMAKEAKNNYSCNIVVSAAH